MGTRWTTGRTAPGCGQGQGSADAGFGDGTFSLVPVSEHWNPAAGKQPQSRLCRPREVQTHPGNVALCVSVELNPLF